MRRILVVLCVLSCNRSDDAVLAQAGNVRVVLRTSKTWGTTRPGKNPVPERTTSVKPLMLWGEHQVDLWDYVGTARTPWSKDDTVELRAEEAWALYRRNDAPWWAVYRGNTGLFHAAAPVQPDAVPPLREARAAIFARQLADGLREKIINDANADGEDALVDLLVRTVDAKEHGDTDWGPARTKLSGESRATVDAALLAAYRERPNTFVISRASTYLDLAPGELDAANRAALLELQRAANEKDSWGVHYKATKLLPQLACSLAFEDERTAVHVECPETP